jgi:hypothetical protein
MKKYVNGYGVPRIEIIRNNIVTTYDFTFKIQALKEYYEPVGEMFVLPDGRKKPGFDYYNYEWVLDYSGYIEAEDRLKFKEIEDADRLEPNTRIYLTPHREVFYRKFLVHVAFDKKGLDTWHDFGGKENTPNKDFIITFVNAERITSVQIQDTDWLPVISAESCFEN